MSYICADTTKSSKKWKLLTTQKNNQSFSSNDTNSNRWVNVGPIDEFLKCFGLDEKSNQMDWMSAFLPMLPELKMDDAWKVNIKGDMVTKVEMSNWTIYCNLKAILFNTREEGHILEGKLDTFENFCNTWGILSW